MPTKNWGESSVWGFSVLGGGSVVLALALMCIEKMGWMPAASASTFTAQLGVFFGFAAIWINYPHAVWSYRLAYGQGPGFVRSHPGTLIFIPILMMLAFGAVYFFRETSIQSHPYLLSLDQAFEWAGIFFEYFPL